MANMGFKNFREPVVYILDQEIRKRSFKNKINTVTDAKKSITLPEYPVRAIRDSINNKVVKLIYAEGTNEEWSEELMRTAAGKVERIITTYPDKSTKTIDIFKDINNRFESATQT